MVDIAVRRGRPRSEARNAEILWAAAQLFATRGVAGTSTREIAAQAGTTERTLFKHFGSKDGLVHAVIDEAVVTHLAPISLEALRRSIAGFDGDLEAWHRQLLASRLQALAGAPELTRLLLVELVRDESLRQRFAAKWLALVWEPLTGLFSGLQAEGRLRSDLNPEQLARTFLSLNLGFLVSRIVLARELHWDEESEMHAIASIFAVATRP